MRMLASTSWPGGGIGSPSTLTRVVFPLCSGRIFTVPAPPTPGSDCTRCLNCSKNSIWRLASVYFAAGGTTVIVSNLSGLNPTFDCNKCSRLFIIKPAPTNKTTAKATSVITSAPRRRCPLPPAVFLPPSVLRLDRAESTEARAPTRIRFRSAVKARTRTPEC